jgi:hypothetical protein
VEHPGLLKSEYDPEINLLIWRLTQFFSGATLVPIDVLNIALHHALRIDPLAGAMAGWMLVRRDTVDGINSPQPSGFTPTQSNYCIDLRQLLGLSAVSVS